MIKPELFQRMLETYKAVKDNDFISMQAFNDMLNMLEIKLGPVPVEMEQEKEGVDQKDAPVCNSCGNVNRITAKYCDECGTKL